MSNFRYQLRPKAGTQYHLCPPKDVETALELASIVPNPKSTAHVAGRTYTFTPGEEITPGKGEDVDGMFELLRRIRAD